jgi:hypothetical protein
MIKRFKNNLPNTIVGMSLEQAKMTCLSEGYILSFNNTDKIDLTYLVTVVEMSPDGKILNAKYGK